MYWRDNFTLKFDILSLRIGFVNDKYIHKFTCNSNYMKLLFVAFFIVILSKLKPLCTNNIIDISLFSFLEARSYIG